MFKSLFLFSFIATIASAEEAPHIEKKVATAITSSSDKSVLFIEPKNRAADYVQAFELLRKDKPSLKINLRTNNGQTLQVTELLSSTSGTLLFAKVNSNSGSKYLIVPLEEIVELAYSPS